jgi:hypothetical protein
MHVWLFNCFHQSEPGWSMLIVSPMPLTSDVVPAEMNCADLVALCSQYSFNPGFGPDSLHQLPTSIHSIVKKCVSAGNALRGNRTLGWSKRMNYTQLVADAALSFNRGFGPDALHLLPTSSSRPLLMHHCHPDRSPNTICRSCCR